MSDDCSTLDAWISWIERSSSDETVRKMLQMNESMRQHCSAGVLLIANGVQAKISALSSMFQQHIDTLKRGCNNRRMGCKHKEEKCVEGDNILHEKKECHPKDPIEFLEDFQFIYAALLERNLVPNPSSEDREILENISNARWLAEGARNFAQQPQFRKFLMEKLSSKMIYTAGIPARS